MVIFLNGSINSGKSTIARLLVKELPDTALIEIDVFREMIGWMPLDKSIQMNLENALSVIHNFAQKGIGSIVPYPLSQNNYEYMMNGLKDLDVVIHIFTLAPKLEKALTNRGSRELTKQEEERIRHHYQVGIPKPSFGEIIDNSDQTPEETVEYILGLLKA